MVKCLRSVRLRSWSFSSEGNFVYSDKLKIIPNLGRSLATSPNTLKAKTKKERKKRRRWYFINYNKRRPRVSQVAVNTWEICWEFMNWKMLPLGSCRIEWVFASDLLSSTIIHLHDAACFEWKIMQIVGEITRNFRLKLSLTTNFWSEAS